MKRLNCLVAALALAACAMPSAYAFSMSDELASTMFEQMAQSQQFARAEGMKDKFNQPSGEGLSEADLQSLLAALTVSSTGFQSLDSIYQSDALFQHFRDILQGGVALTPEMFDSFLSQIGETSLLRLLAGSSLNVVSVDAPTKREVGTVQALQSLIGGGGSGTSGWTSLFPNYSAATRTSAWTGPGIPSHASASYSGKVRGQTAGGDALSGTSDFRFYFTGAGVVVSGASFILDGETVNFTGSSSAFDVNLTATAGSAFKGGTVAAGSGFTGNFFGSGAEEFGGNFGFDVTGGTAAGTATGDFAASR